MLSERFPEAHVRRRHPTGVLPTGVPALDDLLDGGLPKGEVTELVGEGPGSGSAQVIHALLAQATADGRFLALVDASDSFDVDAPAAEALTHLLWVRCGGVDESLKAADILLRDRNIPLVVLDLKLAPAVPLRKIASSVWHRFKRLAEHTGVSVLVVTPFPMVGAVAVRVESRAELSLASLSSHPSEVIAGLRFELLRAAETAPVTVRTGGPV